MKVYIWGTGQMAQQYLNHNEIDQDDLLGFIETKKSKSFFYNKKIFQPEEIVDTIYDFILVCVIRVSKEIIELCDKIGIAKEKVILMDNWEWMDGSSMKTVPDTYCKRILKSSADFESIFPQFYQCYAKEQDLNAKRYLITLRNGFDLIEKEDPFQTSNYSGISYQTDYFRFRTFELMANEINRCKIRGNVAELGVFKGTFSKLINEKFKDRILYLFDTFESFDKEEYKDELQKERCQDNFFDVFTNTSIEKVLSNMPYPKNCIIKKGFFPDSLNGELNDERYAFVSIDVDFENSILEGLRYFYPRLNEGGTIFLHDYNNRFLGGVKRAVERFEKEISEYLRKVPLADEGGTLVIVK